MRFNQYLITMLDYFLNFVTFIDVLSKTFLDLPNLLFILQKKNTPFDRLLVYQKVFDNLKKIVTKA